MVAYILHIGTASYDSYADLNNHRRWLAHTIAQYYGLASQTVMAGYGTKTRRLVSIEGSGGVRGSMSPSLAGSRRGSAHSKADAYLHRALTEICQLK